MYILHDTWGILTITDKKPRFWGTWKGQVIYAIAWDGANTLDDLKEKTDLSEDSLNDTISQMFDLELMEIKNGNYRVSFDLWLEYIKSDFVKEYNETSFSTEKKKALFNWIEQWKTIKDLKFTTDAKHFFLEGRYLDELSKDLITKADSEVLVVNPFVNKCALSDTLKESASRGTRVKLLTRPPEDKTLEYRRAKEEYHSTLKLAGVEIRYDRTVHAKIITIDRAVAISSSMNFYCGSSGGKCWEAGIVTLEQTVVEPIISKILKIFEKYESKEMQKSTPPLSPPL